MQGVEELDAGGCIVTPGLVDLHVHLREPGMEDAETIETGARAAALGGFTAVVAMPNTTPALDDPAIVGWVLAAGRHAPCDVVSSGCITVGRAGEALAPMGELHQLGVRIFTDDGACVADAGVMRHALDYSRALPGAVVAQHAEDPDLAGDGAMHEGAWSSRLGIPGRPAAAEEVVVARDIVLAELTGAHVHFLHVSTAGAVEMVRAAKARGLRVTAEAAPHHFTLTDECCAGFDPVFKVHPPLRTAADVAAVRAGSRRRDHRRHRHRPRAAPRPREGTPVPGGASRHARPRDEPRARRSPSWSSRVCSPGRRRSPRCRGARPRSRGCDAHGGPIAPGAPANLCVIDPSVTWEVDPDRLASKARNTPFAGRKLTGPVPPHDPRRRAGGRRRGARLMAAATGSGPGPRRRHDLRG